MPEFEITAPDGKKYRVSGNTAQGAKDALMKHLGQAPTANQSPAQPQSAAPIPRGPKGSGYSSNNGSTEADFWADVQKDAIAEHPFAARAAKFLQGVPFIGEYADEAVGAFSPKAGQAMRVVQGAMRDQKPVESAALQVGAGIMTGAAAAGAAGPSIASKLPASMAGKIATGAVAGAAAGGVEGAVSGYGADRTEGAISRGKAGAAVGGALGAAAPLAASGLNFVAGLFRSKPLKSAAEELGISKEAAEIVARAIDADGAVPRGTMVADTGQATAGLLDTAIQNSGRGATIARDGVESRAAQAVDAMTGNLDRFLGKPAGATASRTAIREGTQAVRKIVYDAAYAKPIDYASSAGRRIESLLGRVPAAAVKRANELMKVEGVESAQIMAEIVGDQVNFTTLPDVRQIDYITRALGDIVEANEGMGKLGGQTSLGGAYQGLIRGIRGQLKKAVPEYGIALDTASDAISRSRAIDTGYDALTTKVRPDQLAEAIKGASQSEKEALKSGIRSYIEDQMAAVQRAVSDGGMEAREAIKAAKLLSSRANRAKLTQVLGGAKAKKLLSGIDEAMIPLELRAQVATNSRTFGRQETLKSVIDMTAPGVVGEAAQGRPVAATQRIVQALTRMRPQDIQARQEGIFADIAEILVSEANPPKRVISILSKANAKEPLKRQEARYLANAVTAAMAGAVYQSAVPRLGTP